MSHVLLGGDEQQVTELRFLLAKWGVTVGQLPFVDDVPTVLDCDAVILQGNFEEFRDACLGTVPDGSRGAAAPAAPLIFINSADLSLTELPAQWLVLAGTDRHGAELRLALRSSLNRASELRREVVGEGVAGGHQESDSYLHFLGHELRSPLTAIKTSLEVLEGEMGGMGAEGVAADPKLKMVDIALRNVRRLHQTVEWSQDLLAANAGAGPVDWQQVAIDEIVGHWHGAGEVSVAEGLRDLEVQTDARLLSSVVTQMSRAVSMACPNSPIAIRLEENPAQEFGLQLIVAAADGEHELAAAASHRTRLVNATAGVDPADELERLARFMVAPQLVETLAATLVILTVAKDRPALALNLSAAPQAISNV